MTKLPFSAVVLFLLAVTVAELQAGYALGNGGPVAVSNDPATVCWTTAVGTIRSVSCRRPGASDSSVIPNISFSEISGGTWYFCGLASDGSIMRCWDALNSNSTLSPKWVYRNAKAPLKNLAVGDDQVCALVKATGQVKCWRIRPSFEVPPGDKFLSISSGFGFSCGILANTRRVECWGINQILNTVTKQNWFESMPMQSIFVGGSHACGINSTGFVVCKGNNSFGQLDVPSHSAEEFSMLSLGASHSCAIRRANHTVTCWGGGGRYSVNRTQAFDTIVSGSNFTCGLKSDVSIICWGPGWNGSPPPVSSLPPPPPPPPPMPRQPRSRALTRGLLAFMIVGSIGTCAGLCTVVYWLWSKGCFAHRRVHNSVQPTITRGNSNGGTNSNNSPPSRSSTIVRRQSSKGMRRQRSGTSSFKHAERAEEFSFSELAAAAGDFSFENKIGAGSFGVVYRGKLPDGREVAIKRGETGPKTKKFQEKESAYDSELEFLSRLHHKHLVSLVGYCEENDERLLVYEFMKNGALYDHLHNKNNVAKSCSPVNQWKMRIKIALDASRGIEYLHNYAVPPIIHRDIKSSNILLDANWMARVSDFGLSLMGPASDHDLRPPQAAGTVGYIDPEYYGLNVLTTKSDVYGFGVVLLELLTGKRAIFKSSEDERGPISIVDYAVPAILAGELKKILDSRVELPESNEADAVELVAYMAVRCVNLEGKDRPTMTDIVVNLERALVLCEISNGGISSGPVSRTSSRNEI